MLFFASDGLVFRSGWYHAWVKPESSIGRLLWSVRKTEQLPRDKPVLAILGDSRVEMGFSEREFDAAFSAQGIRVHNLAVAGTSPRVWYHLIRRVDPDKNRFRAVAIPLLGYRDVDRDEPWKNRNDLAFMPPLLEAVTTPRFLASFDQPAVLLEAVTTTFFAWYAYRRDLRDLLANPRQRQREITHFYRHRRPSEYAFIPSERSLDTLRVAKNQILGMPEDWDPSLRQELQHLVFQPFPP